MAPGDGSNRLLLICIYDSKAGEVLGGLFLARTGGEGVRMFTDAVNRARPDEPSLVQMHPEDFELVQVGYFDRASCEIEALHRVLVRGIDVVVRSNHNREEE